MKKQFPVNTFIGYLLFFLTISVTVTCSVLIYSFLEDRYGANRGLIAGVMFACIVLLALACTVIDTVRRKFTEKRSVRRILDATERISAGDFSVRLIPRHLFGHYDEYDRIMINVNSMARELSKTEVLRSDFISNVSHEIKTPLSVIRSYASALQEEGLSGETRKKYAQTLVTASGRLSDLIGNILKLNKLENSEILPERENVRLGDQVSECVLSFEDAYEEKGIGVECDIDDVTVFSASNYLEIVWNNLLSNAIKFTPDGGRIFVSVKREEDKAVVRVEDNGCGISADIGEHIFEKFYQGDTSHKQEGNGLGLALVKKVIDLLGGEISVESDLGKGSVFTVKLKCEAERKI